MNSSIDYQQKYLKYKKKYITFRNQLGGVYATNTTLGVYPCEQTKLSGNCSSYTQESNCSRFGDNQCKECKKAYVEYNKCIKTKPNAEILIRINEEISKYVLNYLLITMQKLKKIQKL